MANSPSGESVIHRVVRILSAFRDENPALHLRALARQVDLPVSTVHRLVGELEVEGLLVRDDSGQLRHGHRLWELASSGSRASSLREAALPPMEDLVQQTGSHVSLGVVEGTDVLYLERLAVDDATVNITKVAGRLPVHGCSAGLVYMAFAPADEQERFLRRRLEKLTRDTVVDPGQLRALLAGVRQNGYISMAGIIVPESSGISVPIFAQRRRVVAMLTLIVGRGEEHLQANLPQLQFASRAISRRLGYELEGRDMTRHSAPMDT
ncbi:IclR family transcriptional regulator [Glutamicibacter sp. MNS18]|uniref:IclR family transcriptional regulator n=1 Tax=Glutamicibacter sp. MNS18 TaxID=2989817 RepID=UPI002235DAB8|nr:IclR family transcriptional regulator [Glutamicibacter sp. MNS18]MCW4466446.1 IclR family transcriptional regulator [Glutamicibacter sp. MNS18]